MPSGKKSKRYFYLLLILIPLFVAFPAVNYYSVKQKVFLAAVERPLLHNGPSANFPTVAQMSVVHHRETDKMKTSFAEEIHGTLTSAVQDTSLKQSQLQQMNSRDWDNSGTVKTPGKKDSIEKK